MPTHLGAAALGVVAFLLAVVGLGETYGYISSSTLAGLTPAGFGFFVALAIAAAVGVYILEDRDAADSRFRR